MTADPTPVAGEPQNPYAEPLLDALGCGASVNHPLWLERKAILRDALAWERAEAQRLTVERLRRDLWDSRRHEANLDGSACWCVIEPMPPIDHEEMCLRLRAVLAALAQEETRA